MTKFRKRLFEIVQIGAAKDLLSRSFDVIISVIIVLNIVVTFLATFKELNGIMNVLKGIELATIIFFTIEYIARLITADFLYPNKTKGKSRTRIHIFVLRNHRFFKLLPLLHAFYDSDGTCGTASFQSVQNLQAL